MELSIGYRILPLAVCCPMSYASNRNFWGKGILLGPFVYTLANIVVSVNCYCNSKKNYWRICGDGCVYTTSRSPPCLHEAYKTWSKVSSCLRVFTALTQGKIIFLRHRNVRLHNLSGMTLFESLAAVQTSQYTRVFHTLKDWQKSQMKSLLWIKYSRDLSLDFPLSEWAWGYSEQQEGLYLHWI